MLSRHLGRQAAFEVLATGGFINAQQALDKGLVNRVVAAERRRRPTPRALSR